MAYYDFLYKIVLVDSSGIALCTPFIDGVRITPTLSKLSILYKLTASSWTIILIATLSGKMTTS